jgi:trehalose-6-phosphate hydrolase
MEKSWKNETVYQIYPRSFQDTTGNGYGDINGIIRRLDYLQELGVTYIWLTPMYASPGRDNGYDIADYYAIDPLFGTMADFENLLAQAHQRGLKIMMDLVVNHTSIEHEWFQAALKGKENPYRDYYIWRDPVDGGVPNNWASKFGGSAWEYDASSNQYYLHLYDKTMADLNWENPKVRADIIAMMQWWAKKGIDGFRLDVINNLSKQQDFPNDTFASVQDDGRKFYVDGPRIHEYLHLLHEEVFKPYGLLTVGEMSSTSPEQCVLYTNPDRKELNMVFNFHHMKVDYVAGDKWTLGENSLIDLKKIMGRWQDAMRAGNGWNALFWTNHDQPRALSRFLDDGAYRHVAAKNLAITLFGLQGTTFIYQGEEIAMKNANFTDIRDYDDRESINAYELMVASGHSSQEALAILRQKSRDNCRIPMQWEAGKNYGFTSGRPWLRAPYVDDVNVAAALADKASVFYTYQALIDLRKNEQTLIDGDFKLLEPDNEYIYAYERNYQGRKIVVVSNFTATMQTFALAYDNLHKAEILISNYESPTIMQELVLKPYESLMFRIS